MSKLTESTKGASAATIEFNSAAKSLAAGGVRDLLSGIPILGTAVANLAGSLKGLPLALVAAGAAAYGTVKYLKDLETQMLKTADASTVLSDTAQRKFLDMTRQVKAMRATAAGRPEVAGALDLEGEIAEITRTKQAALTAAGEKHAGAVGTVDRLQALFNLPAFKAKLSLADTNLQKEREAAELTANTAITLAREKFRLNIEKIEQGLTDDHAAHQAKRTQAAEAAAADQARQLEALTGQTRSIFGGLGEQFADVSKSLELTGFVKDTTAAIQTLRQAYEQGVITQDAYRRGTQALTEKMQEAVRLGYVPVTTAAQTATTAVEAAGTAALAAGADFAVMAADALGAAQALAALGAARGRAMAPSETALQPGMSQAEAELAGAQSLSELHRLQSFSATLQEAEATLQSYDRSRSASGLTYQHGGIVPGSGPVPIIAHGGEQILPAGGRSGRGGRGITIAPGAIQITGTVIDQTRDWETLVETLGQALARRR